MGVRRRGFLKAAGALALLPGLESALSGLLRAESPASPFSRFTPIAPSDRDEIVVADGFRHDVLIKWGDPFTASGQRFGFNNDWIGVFGAEREGDLVLAINHEYISIATEGDVPLYPDCFQALRGREASLDDFKRDVGVSVLRVRHDAQTGAWAPVVGDRLNRRIDALTACQVDGPAAALLGGRAVGTFNNCSGGVTPWGTALSCEENFQDWVPEESDREGRVATGGSFGMPGGEQGWVVEVDPQDPGSAPVKRTALGRFRHENVGLRAQAGQPLAAYMGDDRRGGHVWKFVSDESYRPADGLRNRRLLASGRLYAARFGKDGAGEWRLVDMSSPLDPSPGEPTQPILAGAKRLGDLYAHQGAVLVDAYRAANAIGATPSGRPEDLDVHPADGSVFIAFTGASDRPGEWENPFGEVWRIEEAGGDVRATHFRWSRFAAGGPGTSAVGGRVFAQPDNLLFDRRGDLWVSCDISGSKLNAAPEYMTFLNNGFFFFPVTGPERGTARQFLSVPCEAEPTGPAFTPDEDALFLSIQHPGERSGIRRKASDAPRGSNWPLGGLGTPPQPAVIAVRST
jgi:secreted PhoX family phosphatase